MGLYDVILFVLALCLTRELILQKCQAKIRP